VDYARLRAVLEEQKTFSHGLGPGTDLAPSTVNRDAQEPTKAHTCANGSTERDMTAVTLFPNIEMAS
jgi:hypothetical protein